MALAGLRRVDGTEGFGVVRTLAPLAGVQVQAQVQARA